MIICKNNHLRLANQGPNKANIFKVFDTYGLISLKIEYAHLHSQQQCVELLLLCGLGNSEHIIIKQALLIFQLLQPGTLMRSDSPPSLTPVHHISGHSAGSTFKSIWNETISPSPTAITLSHWDHGSSLCLLSCYPFCRPLSTEAEESFFLNGGVIDMQHDISFHYNLTCYLCIL